MASPVTSHNAYEEDPSTRGNPAIPGTGPEGGGGGGGTGGGGGGIGGGGDTGKELFSYTSHFLACPEDFSEVAASHDGTAGINSPGGNTYAVMRDAVGNVVNTSANVLNPMFKYGNVGSYTDMKRAIITFPTDEIDWVPDDVKIRVNIVSKIRQHNIAQFLALAKAAPANPLSIVATDYPLVDHPDSVTAGTLWSSYAPSVSSLVLGANYEFTLNAAGLAAFEIKRAASLPFSVGFIIRPGASAGELGYSSVVVVGGVPMISFAEPPVDLLTQVELASLDHADATRHPQLVVKAGI